MILGAPTLRVRGDYLAIVTLGFGEIIRLRHQHRLAGQRGRHQGHPAAAQHRARPARDRPGRALPDPAPRVERSGPVGRQRAQDAVPDLRRARRDPLLLADPDGSSWSCSLADMLVKDSRVGRAWEATREDEDAAELMGVPTFRYKLLAFALGAAIGGWRVDARGRPGRLHQPGRASCCCCRCCSSPRSSSAAPATGGARSSAASWCLPARAVPRVERLAAADLRGGADGDRRSSARRASCRRGGPGAPSGPRPRSRAARGRRASMRGLTNRPELSAARGAARGRRRHHQVRWRHGARRGHLRHQGGRDPRPDRSQRRRQDHLLQRDDRRLPGDQRPGPVRRARRWRS